MRFRFIFLKDFIFAICSEELLNLLHYRLVILNTTILECLLKSHCIKSLIEKSYEDQKNFSNFLTELLGLIKLTSNSIINNFPAYLIENNLLDTIIRNIHLVLHIEDDLTDDDSVTSIFVDFLDKNLDSLTCHLLETTDQTCIIKLSNCMASDFILKF